MRWALPLLLCLLAPLSLPAAPADEDARLRALLDEEWAFRLEDQPTFATQVGDDRWDDRLDDDSAEAIARRHARARQALARLEALDPARLSPARRLDWTLFKHQLEQQIAAQRFCEECLVLNQMDGVYRELTDLAELMPRRGPKDFERFLARMAAFPRRVEQHLALLERGLARGITPPRVTLQEAGKLIRAQLADDPVQAPVLKVLLRDVPASVGPAERHRLEEAARRAYREQVAPALRKLLAFVEERYVPGARESVGMGALPDGAAWYALRARQATTTDMTPEEIHALGLAEVARIRTEMERVMREAGWTGSLEGFFQHLRTAPRFFLKDREALVVRYRDIAKRIDPELPKLFGKLPRLPYGVRPVPAYAERTQPTAYYQGGSSKIGRAGIFYANTYDVASRPTWEMEALTLHEAVPGHHLQIALAEELGDVAAFRRYAGYTAFVEGWGLYAESLGPALGLFRDPHDRFGQLTYEMWRAVRLVLDTGLHAKGWTREQAIDFFRRNTGKSEHDITVEVDRYIVWPGQALGYKVGELKLKALRAYAERELGARFDVRAFHDLILSAGALPLAVLEERVRAAVRAGGLEPR